MESSETQKPETNALLEKDLIGVTEFIEDTGCDGAGVTVAVMDTGVDPRAYGLRKTSDGRTKVVDMLDLTGDGDVLMGKNIKATYPSKEKTETSPESSENESVEKWSTRGRKGSKIETENEEKGNTSEGCPYIVGLSGRRLFLNEEIINQCDKGQFRLGLKNAWSFWPKELVKKFKKRRRKAWDIGWRKAEEAVRRELLRMQSTSKERQNRGSGGSEPEQNTSSSENTAKGESRTKDGKKEQSLTSNDMEESDISKRSQANSRNTEQRVNREEKLKAKAGLCLRKHELRSQLKVLENLKKRYTDSGPVFDCVTFRSLDGTWRAIVDTTECGNLDASLVLSNYRQNHETGVFAEYDRLTFGVNIYEKGKLLSIVVNGDNHGTAVAGAIGAYCPGEPNLCGVAPGAQIVSLKVSDRRLRGAFASHAQLRALSCLTSSEEMEGTDQTRQHKVNADVVNMSFSGHSSAPGVGCFADIVHRLSREHNVMIVASAGNSGPALSTVKNPAGTHEDIISVGSFATRSMLDQLYPSIGISELFNESCCTKAIESSKVVDPVRCDDKQSSTLSTKNVKKCTEGFETVSGREIDVVPKASEMRAETNAFESGIEGIPFTTSARGPSPDGHFGISICAPGAAVLPRPQWTLSSKELVRGTSVAAPCCAGSIALLLSYLKMKSLPYNSILVRRAIENTAKPLLCSHIRIRHEDEGSLKAAVEFFDHVDHTYSQGSGSLHVAAAKRYLDSTYSSKTFLNSRKRVSQSTKTLPDGSGVPDMRHKLGLYTYLEATRICVLTEIWHPDGGFAPFQRGIYIRRIPSLSGGDTIRSRVTLRPQIDVEEDSSVKGLVLTELEATMSLTATADWIKCPSSILLTGSEQNFKVLLATNTLKVGKVHEAEILGSVENTEEKGHSILFRVPITVILAERDFQPLSGGNSALRFDLGSTLRKFVSPPSGATYCVVEMKASASYGYENRVVEGRKFRIDCAQLNAQNTIIPGNTLYEGRFCVKPGDLCTLACPVISDIPVELCIAQGWESLGKTLLEYVHYSFGGLEVSHPSVHVGRAQASESVTISNRLEGAVSSRGRVESVAKADIAIYFSRIRRVAIPTSSSIESLGLRDILPEDRCVYSLKLEYRIKIPRKGDVIFRQATFRHSQSSMLQGGNIALYTEHKKLLKSVDFGGSVRMSDLEKGKYTVFVELRHDDCSLLKNLNSLRLSIDFKLESVFYTEAYSSEQGATLQLKSDRLGIQCLEPGDQLQVWFGADASRIARERYNWVKDGDQAIGHFKVDRLPFHASELHEAWAPWYEITCDVSVPTSNGSDSSSDCSDCSLSDSDEKASVSEKMEENSKNAKLDYLLKLITAKKWEDFDKVYNALQIHRLTVEDDFTLKMYRLNLKRHAQEEKSLKRIISAAGQVLTLDTRVIEIKGTLDAYANVKYRFDMKKKIEQMAMQKSAVIEAYYIVCKSLLNDKLEENVGKKRAEKLKDQEDFVVGVEGKQKIKRRGEEHDAQGSNTGEEERTEALRLDHNVAEGQSVEKVSNKKDGEEGSERAFEEEDLETCWMGLRKWANVKARVSRGGVRDGISSEEWRKLLIKREMKRERFGTALGYLKSTKDEEDAELKIDALGRLGWTFAKNLEMTSKKLDFPKEYVSFWGHQ